jgi:CRISPR-associated endonuclease/helicase Cas3
MTNGRRRLRHGRPSCQPPTSWALTTIRGKLPGRPPVEPYLHGISGWEPPETHVAWREEVGVITGPLLLERYKPEDLLEDYPLKPHELLRDNSNRVFDCLKKLKADAETPVWLVADDDSVKVSTLGDLRDAGKDELNHKTVLLPPAAGGLENGLLTSDAPGADNDVADEW